MTVVYNNLNRLYNGGVGPLTKDGLKRAVALKWISTDEYQQISGEAYSA
nr:MAG TPA: hypothetical protein [Caudoviricetes sp.]